MSFTTKLATGVLLAAAASTALTGCGKKSSTTTPSMSTSAKSSSSSSMTSSMSSSAKPTATATINGQIKHIKAGQQCQSKYASQYTQYGFTCAPKTSGSSEYVLTAK